MIKFLTRNNPLKFHNSWLFIPITMIAIYGFQSIFALYYLGGKESTDVISIFCIGFLGYSIFNRFISKIKSKNDSQNFNQGTFRYLFFWILFIAAAYSIVIIYALLTAEKIALWEALKGATAIEIAQAREMLFRAREGNARVLPYMNAILSTALMPYIIMLAFVYRLKIAWPLFILFSLSLLFSMEKALILKAMLPIFLLSVNGYVSKKYIYAIPILTLSLMMTLTYLARGSDAGISAGVPNLSTQLDENGRDKLDADSKIVQEGKMLSVRDHIAKYYPLRFNSTTGQLINRAVWIPYITAYDWIKYFHEEMNEKHLYGTTSLFLSKIVGKEQFMMERAIFDYQFGLGQTKTAAANTNFMIDAFVNFGYFGVFIIAGLIGAIVAFVARLANPAAESCLYMFLFQLISGGVLGVLLGGGLLVFLCVICIVRPTANKVA